MKTRLLLISILISGLILFPVILNLTIIKSRITYSINYDVKGSDKEKIIAKVETFNYTRYLENCKERDDEFNNFIDSDFVQFLKGRIENDTKFHWEMFYGHFLRYFFIGENHSKLYLTYNNNSIFNLEDQNNQSLFAVEYYSWDEIAWYLNFTQLPYAISDKATILLNNAIFIKLYLHYGFYCGSLCALDYSIYQFLVLNPNLDVLMIFIPYSLGVIVA
jgi:hypothetical protein